VEDVAWPINAVAGLAQKYIILRLDFGDKGDDVELLIFRLWL
jgi:hypothetical protein